MQWSRTANGIEVVAVRDFGLLPISGNAKRGFAQELADALPPVPRDMWQTNRFAPTPANVVVPPPPAAQLALLAQNWVLALPGPDALYDHGAASPRSVVRGDDLRSVLVNLPANSVVNDFVLDLSTVLYSIIDRVR